MTRHARIHIRLEQGVKDSLIAAAKRDNRNLSQYLIVAGWFYDKHLQAQGDKRRKAVAS